MLAVLCFIFMNKSYQTLKDWRDAVRIIILTFVSHAYKNAWFIDEEIESLRDLSRTFLNNCFPVLWLWNGSFAFLTPVITTKIQMHVCSCYNSISVRSPLAFKSYIMSFHHVKSSVVISFLFKEVKDDHIISFHFIFCRLWFGPLPFEWHNPSSWASWSLECFERWM